MRKRRLTSASLCWLPINTTSSSFYFVAAQLNGRVGVVPESGVGLMLCMVYCSLKYKIDVNLSLEGSGKVSNGQNEQTNN